jgi:hypothetical protein
VKISGGKTSSASMGGGVATPALTHALDLFDSGMSATNVAAAALVPRRKRPRRCPPPKAASKCSGAPAVKGISRRVFIFHLS